MTWHYQVMKHIYRPGEPGEETHYAIHEYYNLPDGDAWSETPAKIFESSVEDLEATLELMLKDLKKYGVKDYQ